MVRERINTDTGFYFVDDNKNNKNLVNKKNEKDTRKLFPWLIPIINSYDELTIYLQQYNSTKKDLIIPTLINYSKSLKKTQKEKNSDETVHNEIIKLLNTLEEMNNKHADNEFLRADINKIIKEFDWELSGTQYQEKYITKVRELIEKTNFRL